MGVVATDGRWSIITQTITVKGVEMEVPVRLCRFGPPYTKEDGTQGWFLLKTFQWQVCVRYDKTGEVLRVRRGVNGGWRVLFPDRERPGPWYNPKATTLEEGRCHPERKWPPMNDDAADEDLAGRFGRTLATLIGRLISDASTEASSKKAA